MFFCIKLAKEKYVKYGSFLKICKESVIDRVLVIFDT